MPGAAGEGIPADALVVGSVARLARQKRFDRLLRALALLPEPVHCLIVGEGEEREPTRAFAAGLGMAERVHLPGFRSDVGDVLDAMDLFAVSSDREGLANAMLEAMAFGLPVVSTDVSGAREALEPGGDGVAPGVVVGFDDDALVGSIADLLADDGRRLAMGQAARRVAEERFGWERFVDEWERLLASGARR